MMCNFPNSKRGDIISIIALTLCPWCGAKQQMLVRGWFVGCRDDAGKHIDIVDGPSRCRTCGRGTGHWLVEEPEPMWKPEPPTHEVSKSLPLNARSLLDDAIQRGAKVTITERQIVFDYAHVK
jgi:hypothetical protein